MEEVRKRKGDAESIYARMTRLFVHVLQSGVFTHAKVSSRTLNGVDGNLVSQIGILRLYSELYIPVNNKGSLRKIGREGLDL